MARLFDDAQNEYLSRAEAVKNATPFAMVCWFYSDDITIKQCLMGIGDADNDDNYFTMNIRGDAAGDYLHAALAQAGAGTAAITTSGYSANTWHHGCSIYASATDRRALIDGGSKGTDAVNKTPVAGNLDTTSIGILDRLNDYGPTSGRIAEAAIYDLSAYPGATDSDKADYFEANVLPHLVAEEPPGDYTTGLEAYWPLRDDDEDDADDFDLTPYNTPSWAEHPTVMHLLSGLLAAQSALAGDIDSIQELSGSLAAQSALTGNLQWVQELSGSLAAQSALTGNLQWVQELSGSLEAQSALTGNLQFCYGSIPAAMHAALIDPYSGGAWLWLVEINIPGYELIRMARNPVDIVYGGLTYLKNNFDPGLAPLTGDGSVPRALLKVAQDAGYTLEDKINATQGAGGGTITVIRAHEDFLATPILELEQVIKILTADSDTTHVIFQLGIPDPLLRKVPLRRYSSKRCPYALPGLFKGPECQYAGEDGTCTGNYEDCLTKGNAAFWGADLGLDPNTARV